MKKKKGFTLIEMLGIIVILAVILLLVIPVIDTNLQKKKDDLYTTQIENISLALKNWGADNMFNLPNEEGGAITVTLGQLKQAGFIDEDISNPITGECFPNDMLLTITKQKNNYKYEVITDSGSAQCDEILNINAPIIGLKGRTVVYVEINTQYVEPGLIVAKSDGTPISSDKVTKEINGPKNYIDTSVLGTYQIKYNITDAGSSNSITRTVIVRDTIAPVITVEKVTNIASLGAIFDVMQGVSATDNSKITPSISSSGIVNTNLAGTYTITYTATDDSGNKTTEKRKVIVSDTTPPRINVAIIGNPFSANGWTNGNVEVKIDANDTSSGIAKIFTCVSKNGKCTPSISSNNSSMKITVSEEGSNNYVCAYAQDTAGNKSSTICTSQAIKIDKTAPSCTTSSPKGTLGENGWYKSAVTVTGTCNDTNGSGCINTTVSSQYGSNTSGTTISPGIVSDNAGNSAECPASSTIKIDLTAPICNTYINGNVNSRGWYQTKSVNIEGQCSDSGSGCVENSKLVVGETRGGYYSPGNVTDYAGNTASCPSQYMQVDGTPPVFVGTITEKSTDSSTFDVQHKTKFYDEISEFPEMVYEYWWCSGDETKCSEDKSGNYFMQYAGYTEGYVGFIDRYHVGNNSTGVNGKIWFTWQATDAAGNKTTSCRYSSTWTNYISNGYSGC